MKYGLDRAALAPGMVSVLIIPTLILFTFLKIKSLFQLKIKGENGISIERVLPSPSTLTLIHFSFLFPHPLDL